LEGGISVDAAEAAVAAGVTELLSSAVVCDAGASLVWLLSVLGSLLLLLFVVLLLSLWLLGSVTSVFSTISAFGASAPAGVASFSVFAAFQKVLDVSFLLV
jgi:hypothetical protein